MNITVQELKRKFSAKEDFILIDVRETHEYEEFNLGGNLIPLGEIPEAISDADLKDKKNAEIIVHCRSGARSGRAQQFMMAEGFTNVSNLEGGVLAWIDAFGS